MTLRGWAALRALRIVQRVAFGIADRAGDAIQAVWAFERRHTPPAVPRGTYSDPFGGDNE